MSASDRINFKSVPRSGEILTPDFLNYVLSLHDRFNDRIQELRADRLAVSAAATGEGRQPAHLAPSPATTTNWQVPEVPEELRQPGIEISGPVAMTSMFINALNPMPDGTQAVGDLDDDEDAAGHTLSDTIQSAINRRDALLGNLEFHDEARDRHYKLWDGPIPFFMHRERGLHLNEPDFSVDGVPISATLLGTAATLFHAGRVHAEQGKGIYFYLPKTESVAEARLYRDVFDASRELVPHLSDAVIRGVILVESLPAVWQMEEMLYELGPYAAGLNAARWDLKASLLEFVMNDPDSLWPDRFGVDVKATPFISNIFRRLVAVCLKHGAVPIGGMATQLPSRDEAVNEMAAKAIRADKVWEAENGFLRGWTAHIYHQKTAADPFKELHATGWQPTDAMKDPDNFPVKIETPEGPVTQEGSRRNVRTIIEYVEGWLNGRGAKGIDSLEGHPGIHPALMEDLATARISVAQTAQRVVHAAACEDTERNHDLALIKELTRSEGVDIIDRLGDEADDATRARYRESEQIVLGWIKRYTEFNFRSLGSYTREELHEQGTGPDAF
jgi:malate synthase